MVSCESRPSPIGPITLDTKQTGAPSAGNPHAGCDVAGAGNGFTVWLLRHSQRKRGATARLHLRNTAPVLDPTGISSGNQALTRCAFIDSNPTDEAMTSGLPVIRPQSAEAPLISSERGRFYVDPTHLAMLAALRTPCICCAKADGSS